MKTAYGQFTFWQRVAFNVRHDALSYLMMLIHFWYRLTGPLWRILQGGRNTPKDSKD